MVTFELPPWRHPIMLSEDAPHGLTRITKSKNTKMKSLMYFTLINSKVFDSKNLFYHFQIWLEDLRSSLMSVTWLIGADSVLDDYFLHHFLRFSVPTTLQEALNTHKCRVLQCGRKSEKQIHTCRRRTCKHSQRKTPSWDLKSRTVFL